MSRVVAVQELHCMLVFSVLFTSEIKQNLLLATTRSRTSGRFHVSYAKRNIQLSNPGGKQNTTVHISTLPN